MGKMAGRRAAPSTLQLITWIIAIQSLVVTCLIPENSDNNTSSQAAQHSRNQHDILSTIIPKRLAKPEQATDDVESASDRKDDSRIHDGEKPFSEHIHHVGGE